MLDRAAPHLVAQIAPPVRVDPLVLGQPRSEVADLMPRLFNLCRAAQGAAARGALSLPIPTDTTEILRAEILRDHVLRLTIVLPGHFGLAPMRLPEGWQSGGPDLARALFGPTGALPEREEDFDAFLASGVGVAGLISNVRDLFTQGEAVSRTLPHIDAETALDATACVENSCATRVANHPVLRALEARLGRGPVWRVVARAYDLMRVMNGQLPPMKTSGQGRAYVPATRGLYSVEASVAGETVTAFHRVTPTDHLIAPGGVLEQTLATLNPAGHARAPLVLDILDPCTPIKIRQVPHA